ncbi:AAEL000946-PA, partial [Aedes aegypti]
LVTQTVYGFLDFTTTIGNTVMIFSPQSSAAAVTGKSLNRPSLSILPSNPPIAEPPKTTPAPPPVIETSPPPTTPSAPIIEEIKPSKTVILPVQPKEKYDFLSRQPSEFVEETYRVVNLKPTPTSSASSAPTARAKPKRGNKKPRPTGLVTKLGGTVVKDGATTVHETSVIGTYISGKYAQVLQSTSHLQPGEAFAPSQRSRSRSQWGGVQEPTQESHRQGRQQQRPAGTPSFGNGKKTNRYRNTQTSSSSSSYSAAQQDNRRSFKPNLRPTPPEGESGTTSTSLYKFKLNRSPGRWQYKSPPKPTVNIRKQPGGGTKKPNDGVENLTTAPISDTSVQYNDISQNPDHSEKVDTDADLDQSGSVNGNVLNDAENDNQIERRYPVETIKVEISTPVDFKDTYYEIATIKSPYTFQVGTVKNTRYITVTSTFEKVLEQETATITPSLTEPLTENILATTSHIDKESNLLDSSIATLPAIALSGDTETPPLETLTETFSTTQVMLKTHILPVIRDGTDTTSYTLIQTYHVTRLVTATKTLPPMEIYQFVPSKTLNEFNSRLDEAGSELHLELEFGDENDEDDDKPKLTTEAPVTTPSLTPEQIQQLALLRLLNPAAAAQIPSVITSSKPVVSLETVYESHVLPIINGQNTIFSTISRPIGTLTKTNYEVVTTTLPALPIPPIPQLNPFQQQPQVTVQSTPVVTNVIVTETNSKVLKLTFGAKTAYTTLYSTTVVPTQLTTYVTQSVPVVQPTAAAFPGYFPAPYAPFPYVG